MESSTHHAPTHTLSDSTNPPSNQSLPSSNPSATLQATHIEVGSAHPCLSVESSEEGTGVKDTRISGGGVDGGNALEMRTFGANRGVYLSP